VVTSESRLRGAFDLLFTDAPVLDVYAYGPWPVPNGLLDELATRVGALVADPRSASLLLGGAGSRRSPADPHGSRMPTPAFVVDLRGIVAFLCGDAAIRTGSERGIEDRLIDRLRPGDHATDSTSSGLWLARGSGWRPPGRALFAAAGQDKERRQAALALTVDALHALEGIAPLEDRRKALLKLYEQARSNPTLTAVTLATPYLPTEWARLEDRWAEIADDEIVSAVPELTGPVGYLSWVVDGWVAAHERLVALVPGSVDPVRALASLMIQAGLTEAPAELAVGVRGDLYTHVRQQMRATLSSWDADAWRRDVRDWLARAMVAGELDLGRAWLDLAVRLTGAVQGLPGLPVTPRQCSVPVECFQEDMRRFFRVRKVRHPLTAVPSPAPGEAAPARDAEPHGSKPVVRDAQAPHEKSQAQQSDAPVAASGEAPVDASASRDVKAVPDAKAVSADGEAASPEVSPEVKASAGEAEAAEAQVPVTPTPVEPVRDRTEPDREGAESARQSGEESARQSVESVGASTEPAREPAAEREPTPQSVEPARESVEPAGQSAQPAREGAEPVRQTAEPARESVEPARQTVEPERESVAPVREPESVEHVRQSAEPAREVPEPVRQSAEPAKRAQPAQEPAGEGVARQNAEPVREPSRERVEPVSAEASRPSSEPTGADAVSPQVGAETVQQATGPAQVPGPTVDPLELAAQRPRPEAELGHQRSTDSATVRDMSPPAQDLSAPAQDVPTPAQDLPTQPAVAPPMAFDDSDMPTAQQERVETEQTAQRARMAPDGPSVAEDLALANGMSPAPPATPPERQAPDATPYEGRRARAGDRGPHAVPDTTTISTPSLAFDMALPGGSPIGPGDGPGRSERPGAGEDAAGAGRRYAGFAGGPPAEPPELHRQRNGGPAPSSPLASVTNDFAWFPASGPPRQAEEPPYGHVDPGRQDVGSPPDHAWQVDYGRGAPDPMRPSGIKAQVLAMIDTIVGQPALVTALREAVAAPEYDLRLLVAGPPGTGKGLTIEVLSRLMMLRGFDGGAVTIRHEHLAQLDPRTAVLQFREWVESCLGHRLLAIHGLDRMVSDGPRGAALAEDLHRMISACGSDLQVVAFTAADGYRRIVDVNPALAAWWRVVRTRDFDAGDYATVFGRVIEQRGATTTEDAVRHAGDLLAATPGEGRLRNARLATYLAEMAIDSARRRTDGSSQIRVEVADLPRVSGDPMPPPDSPPPGAYHRPPPMR